MKISTHLNHVADWNLFYVLFVYIYIKNNCESFFSSLFFVTIKVYACIYKILKEKNECVGGGFFVFFLPVDFYDSE